MRNSILFIRPDYHCSFFYRDEFRKKNWKADIYVDPNQPRELLFSDDSVLRSPKMFNEKYKIFKLFNHLILVIYWLSIFLKYRYHVYYGMPPVVNFFEKKIGLKKIFGDDFIFELWLSKIMGRKLIFLPTGCHHQESRENFSKFDAGAVCGNCGAWDRCNDDNNNLNFSIIRRYMDMCVGWDPFISSKYKQTFFKYKAIDLNVWHPSIFIPRQYKIKKNNKILIFHGSKLKDSGRTWRGKNIKGSPFIFEAVRKLKEEGHPVEYFYVEDIPINEMRFYQAQADIVVEQLIYGWWGSTFVEASALGKPVVCYLRKSWKQFFFKAFVEYKHLPIIEADTSTIYEELKRLVVDADYRARRGEDSRLFAEQHFDVQRNTSSFIEHLEAL